MMQNAIGIILMGGSGERFGSCLPKQFHRLSGKKLYLHTLERFLESGLFEEILLVTHERWIEEVQTDLQAYSNRSIRIVLGGASRQESSYRGLLACPAPTQLVVIHDAVRPFVSIRILKENVKSAALYGAVDTCIPSTDTLVHSLDGAKITTIPLRSTYFRGQTPQSFSYPLILEAHKNTITKDASDDCSLILEKGHTIHIVPGDEKNIKITTEMDLFLADQLFRLEETQLAPNTASLQGKVFAITGGTGGIGSSVVTLLKQEGALPLIISKSSPDYAFDLTSYEQTEEAFKKIYQEHGPLDGLINCLGLLKVKNVEMLSAAEIQEMIAVNLCGPIYCCKCAILKENAHLVNVASSSYVRGRKNYAIYSSAKAALVNFTQGLAEERPSLRVNALVPGRTNTRMRESFPQEEQTLLLEPEEVANTILTLLKQTGITGSLIKK